MMNNRLTNDAKAVLQYAQEAAQKFHHDYVGTEHILLGLVLNTDGIAGLLLNQLGLTPENVTRAIEQHVGWGQDTPSKLRLTPRTKRAMELAVREANRLEQNYVGTEHMLAGILEEGSGMAVQILEDMDIDPDLVSQRLSELMNDPAVEGGDAVAAKNGSDLSQFGRDLNEWAKKGKIDPVIGREKEISRVIQILSRRTKNNPVLIGAPGVGKTAIAEGLAQRIINGNVPDSLLDKRIFSLDLASIVAGTKYRGEFEERIKRILDVIEQDDSIILFIDEIHQLIGAGAVEGAMDAANILKPALARGDLQCIGATTIDEYKKHFEKDAALARRFQPVLVGEPTEDDAMAILFGLRDRYEAFHKARITDDAVRAAVKLSARYISDRYLPDKAIDLVDEAASHLRMELDSSLEEIDELQRQVDRLKMEKSYLLGNPKDDADAQKAENELDESAKERLDDLNKEIADKSEKLNGLKARWDAEKNGHNRIGDLRKKLDELRTQAERYEREGDLAKSSAINYGEIPAIQKEIAQAEQNEAAAKNSAAGGADGGLGGDIPMVPDRVDADSVAEIVSDWTGIPVGRLMQGENEKLLTMEDYLGKRVIGQKEAIQAVSDAVRRSRAGISDPNRPTGSFLFLGPTGVGKTELAKALADFLFDDEKAMVRIDMSEYMEKASVSRLIGAAPGYIGYEEGGQLTEAVRRRPYSVVLFDEVEKANPEVFDVLLQVLDDGRLTDGQGRTVDFKNTILIMTSNLGSQFLVNTELDDEAKKKAVMDAVHMQFKPEFINRLDELVMFHPLTREELGGIVDIQVAQVSARLADRRIKLDVTDSARDWLANTGYDPAYGARPLRRLVQTEVGDQLARMLLAGEVHDGDTVLVDQTGGDHLELSSWAPGQIDDDFSAEAK